MRTADEPIPPGHRTGEPDERLLLYEGKGTVADGIGNEVKGDTTIHLAWYPSPRVLFQVEAEDASVPSIEVSTAATLTLQDGRVLTGQFVGVQILGLGGGSLEEIVRGIVRGESGSGLIAKIDFDVVNLPRFGSGSLGVDGAVWMGRLRVISDHWELVVDEVQPSNKAGTSLRQRLEQEGGYAITHSGRLQLRSGSSISVDQAKEALEVVTKFLSFLAGSQVGVILPRGIGFDGAVVWEIWDARKIDPWRARISCFPDTITKDGRIRSPELDRVFHCFIELWNELDWSEVLRYGVGWYLTINPHPSAETKIVLGQAALELVSWHLLVPARLSNTGFGNLPASDRLRLLLSQVDVPLEIPPKLDSLAKYAATAAPGKNAWPDGPEALIEARNLLVHPQKKLRPLDLPSGVLIEISELVIWYLQLSLMYVTGYGDRYIDRLAGWTVRSTPWSTPREIPTVTQPHFPPLPSQEQ